MNIERRIMAVIAILGIVFLLARLPISLGYLSEQQMWLISNVVNIACATAIVIAIRSTKK
ncbi:MAG: hypothetical protein RIQ94_515 [Pseudomonadota bacterium]